MLIPIWLNAYLSTDSREKAGRQWPCFLHEIGCSLERPTGQVRGNPIGQGKGTRFHRGEYCNGHRDDSGAKDNPVNGNCAVFIPNEKIQTI